MGLRGEAILRRDGRLVDASGVDVLVGDGSDRDVVVVLELPLSEPQMAAVKTLTARAVVVLPWFACAAAKPRKVVLVVAAGCWPAWPAAHEVPAPSVVPKGEARLCVPLAACDNGVWAPVAMCVCAPRGEGESDMTATACRLGRLGLRGGVAAIVKPDLSALLPGSEGDGDGADGEALTVRDEREMWAACCGLATNLALARWLPDSAGATQELLARLLLRAFVVEGRRLHDEYVAACEHMSVRCDAGAARLQDTSVSND
jgi:hypothetical protein